MNADIPLRPILVDAFKSYELQVQLQDTDAADEQCHVNELPDGFIVYEAAYVLRKYTDGSEGFDQYEEWQGERGKEAQLEARLEVASLRRFLMKYNHIEPVGELAKVRNEC